MKKGCKLCWSISIFLILVIAAAGFKFVTGATVQTHADGRSSVLVTPAERIHVLAEMRLFLETVQTIAEAAAQNDMATITQAASAVGMGLVKTESPVFMAKLPAEMKKMGFATHQAFDDIALAASVTENPMELVADLSDLMLNCTTCHASYRFDAETGATN